MLIRLTEKIKDPEKRERYWMLILKIMEPYGLTIPDSVQWAQTLLSLLANYYFRSIIIFIVFQNQYFCDFFITFVHFSFEYITTISLQLYLDDSLFTQQLHVQILQWKCWCRLWNGFRVANEDIRIVAKSSFWCLYCQL